ncbi:WxL protein peptidoglycan domain-containing protein [Vagococcus zengguangii]|nr:DUF916 domain-containing protein [Vagococcus zengguangii]
MRNLYKFMMLSIVGIVMMCSFQRFAYADDSPTFEYYVTPIFTDNQSDDKRGYFDLLVKPGEVQELKLEVSNTSKQKKKLTITPTTAGTTSNGTIDYSGKEWRHTSNLVAKFSDIASEPQTVELKPEEKKVVTFEVKVPDEKFEGQIVGAFYVKEDSTEKEETKSTSENGIGIKNEFAMIIACVLMTDEKIPDQDFELGPVKIDTYGGLLSLKTDLSNHTARLLTNYSLEGTILTAKGKKVMDIALSDISMAPNSIYEMPLQINSSDFPAGKYKMALTIHDRAKEKEWEIATDFKIKAEERQEAIKESIDSVVWYKTTSGMLIIALIVLVIIMFIVILRNKRKGSQ